MGEREVEILLRGRRCTAGWVVKKDVSVRPTHLGIVVAELDVNLPDCVIKTCGSFKHLNAPCCDTCHTYYPHRQMSLVNLPDGGKAWVCHEIELAIFPEQRRESHRRRRNAR